MRLHLLACIAIVGLLPLLPAQSAPSAAAEESANYKKFEERLKDNQEKLDKLKKDDALLAGATTKMSAADRETAIKELGDAVKVLRESIAEDEKAKKLTASHARQLTQRLRDFDTYLAKNTPKKDEKAPAAASEGQAPTAQ
jgi:hypothetical protein